jgi:hypothetical protein
MHVVYEFKLNAYLHSSPQASHHTHDMQLARRQNTNAMAIWEFILLSTPSAQKVRVKERGHNGRFGNAGLT